MKSDQSLVLTSKCEKMRCRYVSISQVFWWSNTALTRAISFPLKRYSWAAALSWTTYKICMILIFHFFHAHTSSETKMWGCVGGFIPPPSQKSRRISANSANFDKVCKFWKFLDFFSIIIIPNNYLIIASKKYDIFQSNFQFHFQIWPKIFALASLGPLSQCF